MFKKIMGLLVLLTLCLGATSCATSGIQYTLSADGTYYIATGYESGDKMLTSLRVPDEYKGLPVKAVDDGIGWTQVVADVTKISLPEGLICLGTYFAQVAEVISQEDLPNPELQALLLNSLFALAKLDLPEAQVKAAFELRAACLAGYTPDLTGCHVCGNPNPDRFDLSAGQLVCSKCPGGAGGIRMPVNPGILQAMQYICMCDSKKLFAFSLGEENMASLASITEAYLSTQLERGFSTLDFYNTLHS